MKKLGKQLASGEFAGNPAFEKLALTLKHHQDLVESGRARRKEKAAAFEAASGKKKADGQLVFGLFIEAEKARFDQKIRRADLRLAKFQIKTWLQDQKRAAKELMKKLAPAEKEAKPAKAEKAPKAVKLEKSATKKAKTIAPALPKPTPKAAPKRATTASKKAPAIG